MSLLKTTELEITINSKKKLSLPDFSIKKGEVWGLIGNNGAGKSTLLHTLARLHTPTNGHIFLDQEPYSSIKQKQFAQKIGILFQDSTFLFPESLFDYCFLAAYPWCKNYNFKTKKIINEKIDSALAAVELLEKKQQNCLTLSGGEKRRLALAALLVQAPQLYLLDEPLNHLDFSHQTKILKLIHSLAQTQKASVLFSVHDVNQTQFCDHIIYLSSEETRIGKKTDILKNDIVSRLYQQKMQQIQVDSKEYWIPKN